MCWNNFVHRRGAVSNLTKPGTAQRKRWCFSTRCPGLESGCPKTAFSVECCCFNSWLTRRTKLLGLIGLPYLTLKTGSFRGKTPGTCHLLNNPSCFFRTLTNTTAQVLCHTIRHGLIWTSSTQPGEPWFRYLDTLIHCKCSFEFSAVYYMSGFERGAKVRVVCVISAFPIRIETTLATLSGGNAWFK